MELGSTSYSINLLYRTLCVYFYDWGAYMVAHDITIGMAGRRTKAKKFRLTKKYNTLESNIERGMDYFNAPQDAIENMVQHYRNIKKR